METIGIALAFVGAALAVGLACSGSARGVGSVGEVGAGVLANDPGKFSQILILQIIPGTQGLYGLVAWFFALMKLGFFSGELRVLTGSEGLQLPLMPYLLQYRYRYQHRDRLKLQYLHQLLLMYS